MVTSRHITASLHYSAPTAATIALLTRGGVFFMCCATSLWNAAGTDCGTAVRPVLPPVGRLGKQIDQPGRTVR